MTEDGDLRPDISKASDVSGGLDSGVVSDFANSGVSHLRRASLSYTGIRDLFKQTLAADQMEQTELLGSDWKWKFTRRPTKKGIDIEIRKFPRSGQSLLEHSIRLRTGQDPLVRTEKVIRDVGPQGLENDEEAIAEAGAFINELLAQF